MAYGELYRCTFDDAAGNECIISIYRDGFAGAVTEVKGGETPIRIEMMAAGDPKYTCIKPTEAYIELVSSTSFQYLQLFTGTNKQHYVNFTVAGTLKWRGWINPELYLEPFQPAPYIVTIHATDGLGSLKNIEGTWTEFGAPPDPPYVNLYAIIFEILGDIGLDLPYQVAVNLQYLTGASPVYERILEKIYIDLRSVRKEDGTLWTSYDILETLLASMTAQVRQVDGAWRIDCIDQKYQAFRMDNYLSDKTYDSTTAAADDRVTLTAATTEPILRFEAGAVLEVEPAFGSFDVYHEYGHRKNILKFNNFDGKFFTDEFTDGSYNDLNYWTLNNSMEVAHEADWDAVRLAEYYTGVGVPPKNIASDDFILPTSVSEFITGWNDQNIRVRFNIDHYILKNNWADDEDALVRVRIYMWVDANFYTYGDNGTGTYAWNYYPDTTTFNDLLIYDYPNQWYNTNIIIGKPPAAVVASPPAALKFQVYVWQAVATSAGTSSDGLCLRNIQLGIEQQEVTGVRKDVALQIVNSPQYRITKKFTSERVAKKKYFKNKVEEVDEYDRTISTTISADNLLKPDDYNVRYGESVAPYGSNGTQQLTHLYNFFDDSGNYIRYWGNYPGSVVIYDLVNTIIKEKLQNYYSYPSFRLRGRIHSRGNTMSFASVIKDYSSRHYFINSVSWNPKEMTWDGEFVQFYPYTVGGDFLDTDFNMDFFIE
jgi:hypothetical protein